MLIPSYMHQIGNEIFFLNESYLFIYIYWSVVIGVCTVTLMITHGTSITAYHISYLSSIIKWTQTGSATNQIRWTTQIPSVFQQWLVFHFVNQKKRRSRTNGLLLQIPELPKLHFQTTLHTPPMASSLTLFLLKYSNEFLNLD